MDLTGGRGTAADAYRRQTGLAKGAFAGPKIEEYLIYGYGLDARNARLVMEKLEGDRDARIRLFGAVMDGDFAKSRSIVRNLMYGR